MGHPAVASAQVPSPQLAAAPGSPDSAGPSARCWGLLVQVVTCPGRDWQGEAGGRRVTNLDLVSLDLHRLSPFLSSLPRGFPSGCPCPPSPQAARPCSKAGTPEGTPFPGHSHSPKAASSRTAADTCATGSGERASGARAGKEAAPLPAPSSGARPGGR